MIRVNLLRFSTYLLSDSGFTPFPDFTLPETVTNPYNPLAFKGFDVSHTATVPKHPLRAICARTPIYEDLYSDGRLTNTWFLDTLECGHQVWKYPLDPTGEKRHRCAECAALTQKKPSSSVGASPRKKEAV